MAASPTLRPPGARRLRRRAANADWRGASCCRTFVDAHTHLDKGHIWRRAPNPTGDFPSAPRRPCSKTARRDWSARDVAARMEFCLRAAYAHGTRAIRTHIDSVGPQTRISWPVVRRGARALARPIDLQASPLFSDRFRARPRPHGRRRGDGRRAWLEDPRRRRPTWSLGCATALDVLFALAERKGWDLDFHVDETADPEARSLGVDRRDGARARAFAGAILVGHCCSLARQEEDERAAHDRSRRARGDQRRLAADVQHVPAGPPAGPHAALARRHRAARTAKRPAST